MSSKKANNSLGLCPVKGQKPSLGTQVGSRDLFSSLSLDIPRPHQHTQCWLTNQCLILFLISCLGTPKAGSGPSRAASREYDFIFLYSSVSTWKGEWRGNRRTERIASKLEASWNVMANAQKPDFVCRRNGRVHLNRRGRHFSRLLAVEVCASALIVGSNAGYTMFRGSEKGGYPLHSLVSTSLPLPCAITFQLESTSGRAQIHSFIHSFIFHLFIYRHGLRM